MDLGIDWVITNIRAPCAAELTTAVVVAVVVALLAARDIRSTLGSNLAHLREMTGLDPWAAERGQLKAALDLATRREVPEHDYWRPPLLQKLLSGRLQAHYSSNLEEEERITTLIDSLVAG